MINYMAPDTKTLEITPNHGRLPVPNIISPDPLMNKDGQNNEQSSGPKIELTPQIINSWLNRLFGTCLHAAFRQHSSDHLIHLASIPKQSKMDLALRPPVSDLISNPVTTLAEFQQQINQPIANFPEKAVQQTLAWLQQLNSYTLSDTHNNQPLTDEQIKFCQQERSKILPVHALLLSGLVEFLPAFTNPNALVLSEVRLQPNTKYIKQLATLVHQPNSVDLNLSQIFTDGIEKAGSLEDFLYDILIKNQDPLVHFKPFLKKLPANLVDLFQLPEANFVAHFPNLSPPEIQTLLGLRLITLAKDQLAFFLGGKAIIENAQKLKQLLEIFPLTDQYQTDDEKAQEITKIMAKLPKRITRILSPIFMAADILILEMPPTANPKIIEELKNYAAQAYQKHSQPALFQDSKFIDLLTAAAKAGLKIRLGDIKSSRQPIPEGNNVKTSHARELAFYSLVLFQAVAAHLHHSQPNKPINVYNVLHHPLIKAYQDPFIVYFGYQEKNQSLSPQLDIRTAFNPQDKQLRRRFVKLMHQINNSMLIRHVLNANPHA